MTPGEGITIENLRISGKVMKSLEEAAVKVDPFVVGVRLLGKDTLAH